MDKNYIAQLAEKIADAYEELGVGITSYGAGVIDGLLVFSQLLKNENGFKGEIKQDIEMHKALQCHLMMEEIKERVRNAKKQKPNNN